MTVQLCFLLFFALLSARVDLLQPECLVGQAEVVSKELAREALAAKLALSAQQLTLKGGVLGRCLWMILICKQQLESQTERVAIVESMLEQQVPPH